LRASAAASGEILGPVVGGVLAAAAGAGWAMGVGAFLAGVGMALAISAWESTLQRHIPGESLFVLTLAADPTTR
jgi:hypothetical protein